MVHFSGAGGWVTARPPKMVGLHFLRALGPRCVTEGLETRGRQAIERAFKGRGLS
jgi:hypothetical protein